MTEINIDNNGDNIEDLVIQSIKRDGKMYFFGPTLHQEHQELSSTIKTSGAAKGNVDISVSMEQTANNCFS